MLGELFGQLQEAANHTNRAKEMIAAALTELDHAEALIRRTMQGSADQSLVATVEQTREYLTGVGQGVNETTRKIDETLTRWRGTGGPGN